MIITVITDGTKNYSQVYIKLKPLTENVKLPAYFLFLDSGFRLRLSDYAGQASPECQCQGSLNLTSNKFREKIIWNEA